MIARICSAASSLGSDSRARIANVLDPTRSWLIRSFSAIPIHLWASARALKLCGSIFGFLSRDYTGLIVVIGGRGVCVFSV